VSKDDGDGDDDDEVVWGIWQEIFLKK